MLSRDLLSMAWVCACDAAWYIAVIDRLSPAGMRNFQVNLITTEMLSKCHEPRMKVVVVDSRLRVRVYLRVASVFGYRTTAFSISARCLHQPMPI